jgi:DnaK suppressor protein
MNPENLERLRQQLVTEREKAESAFHQKRRSMAPSRDGAEDMWDSAQANAESDIITSEANLAVARIAQINDALLRMHHGLYGTCIACDEEIELKRLQALPYAQKCLGCAEIDEAEKQRQRHHPVYPASMSA